MKKILYFIFKPVVETAIESVVYFIREDIKQKMTPPYSDFTDAYLEFNKDKIKAEIMSKLFKS